MSRDEIANLVRGALTSVAPESENQPIDPEVDFREQMDLDSMDFLNFIIALHEATGSISRRKTTRNSPASTGASTISLRVLRSADGPVLIWVNALP